jgi:hypothetical protein
MNYGGKAPFSIMSGFNWVHVSRLLKQHPSHPMVADIGAKDLMFDECASKFEVPPRAVVVA